MSRRKKIAAVLVLLEIVALTGVLGGGMQNAAGLLIGLALILGLIFVFVSIAGLYLVVFVEALFWWWPAKKETPAPARPRGWDDES